MNKLIIFSNAELDDVLGSSFSGLDLGNLGIEEFVPEKDDKQLHELGELLKLNALLDRYDEVSRGSGVDKWFVPGTPFGIEACHKHRAFFDSGLQYNERLFLAGNRCHVAGTKVWMADGTEKNIEDVTIGDKVLAYDVDSGELVPSNVIDTYAGTDDVVWVEDSSGSRGIGTTRDHEFLIRSQRGVVQKKAIQDLNYWDKTVIPTKWSPDTVDPGFSENVAKLLGLLVGDGHLAARDDAFKLTNKSESILQFAETVAREELGLDPRRVSCGNYVDLYFPKATKVKGKSSLGKLLIELGLYGTKSHTKFIPSKILLAPEEHVRAFMQGLLAADAHYRAGRIDLYTTSDQLAHDAVKAFLRLGAPASISTKRHSKAEHRDCHTVNVSGNEYISLVGDAFDKKVITALRKNASKKTVSIKEKYALPKQDVFCITVDHKDHLFIANGLISANCGKSVAGAFEASCHATGDYPSWWAGRVFEGPTNGWAVGSTARATRDTVQKELLGPVGSWGTGMIPKDRIGRAWSLAGVPQGIDIIQIRHKSGGWSTIGFKNYEQPLQAFFGTALDWAWLDEECPIEHYNEILIRTMTTNGIILTTFTPLKGLTPMVVRFSEKADYLAGAEKLIGVPDKKEEDEDARFEHVKSHKAIIQAGWDDAPWLSEEKKVQMEADTEPHLRAARRSGKPSMGSGNVYPVSIESIMCEPFKIPDYYKKLYALDVGWNRTAALWGAIDPQTDCLYVYDEYYVGEQVPAVHAAALRARGTWLQGVIDPASKGRSASDGQQLMMMYRDLGLNLLPANNEVDAGLQNLWQRMLTGHFKVFSNLPNFAKEFVLYRRDLRGRIVKENDHLMDCARYLQNNLARAKSIDQLRSVPVVTGGRKYNI